MHTLHTDDLRIRGLDELITPEQLIRELPCSAGIAQSIIGARLSVERILNGKDDRLIVVIGPCSIHDVEAALEYAELLKAQADRFRRTLKIIMRVYFEKPRTTDGWKGLINDPDLDGTFSIDKGLRTARRLLLKINELGLHAGTEFLDIIIPQFIGDLISWGAIGARTTESQVHREMASGLSCPVGFKNGTDGNIRIAVDAVQAASRTHHFLAVTKQGRSAIAETSGNPACHVILRGGKSPNYRAVDVERVCIEIVARGRLPRVMIDCSHGNSGKKHERQPEVVINVAEQIAGGDQRISGVMLESHLKAGRQDVRRAKSLVYGQSVTDACIDWETSVQLLQKLSSAVEVRRKAVYPPQGLQLI